MFLLPIMDNDNSKIILICFILKTIQSLDKNFCRDFEAHKLIMAVLLERYKSWYMLTPKACCMPRQGNKHFLFSFWFLP